MPGATEFSLQEIMNRVYVSSVTRIATQVARSNGDVAPPASLSAQAVFNRVFDSSESTLRVR